MIQFNYYYNCLLNFLFAVEHVQCNNDGKIILKYYTYNGLRNGEYIQYYPSEKCCENTIKIKSNYIGGILDGEYIEYSHMNEGHNIKIQYTFVNGVIIR